MNNKEFVAKLIKIATKDKTLYVMGCFGAPMNTKNKVRYSRNHSYNAQTERTKMISTATEDTFGFDCSGLIKGVLWGYSSDKTKEYGGAKYCSNNVPDISANSLIKLGKSSSDFSNIEVGEVVWVKDHIGVYVGQGRVVECTPKWSNDVQITYLGNIPEFKRDKYRVWSLHAKIPYITYEPPENNAPDTPQNATEAAKPSNPTENSTNTFRKHTVAKNDTLWGIASKFLSKGSRYPEIKKLNGLTSDTIYVGQILKIPNK